MPVHELPAIRGLVQQLIEVPVHAGVPNPLVHADNPGGRSFETLKECTPVVKQYATDASALVEDPRIHEQPIEITHVQGASGLALNMQLLSGRSFPHRTTPAGVKGRDAPMQSIRRRWRNLVTGRSTESAPGLRTSAEAKPCLPRSLPSPGRVRHRSVALRRTRSTATTDPARPVQGFHSPLR